MITFFPLSNIKPCVLCGRLCHCLYPLESIPCGVSSGQKNYQKTSQPKFTVFFLDEDGKKDGGRRRGWYSAQYKIIIIITCVCLDEKKSILYYIRGWSANNNPTRRRIISPKNTLFKKTRIRLAVKKCIRKRRTFSVMWGNIKMVYYYHLNCYYHHLYTM